MRFTRTSRSTLLTEDGMHLRQRAEEILALGLIDFALMIEPFPLEDYHYIRLPEPIPIGIVTRDDSKWAKKKQLAVSYMDATSCFPVSFTISYAICHQGEKLCFWSSSTRSPVSGVRS